MSTPHSELRIEVALSLIEAMQREIKHLQREINRLRAENDEHVRRQLKQEKGADKCRS
jgi:hypothetical protein